MKHKENEKKKNYSFTFLGPLMPFFPSPFFAQLNLLPNSSVTEEEMAGEKTASVVEEVDRLGKKAGPAIKG
jgi:hypothetical protein